MSPSDLGVFSRSIFLSQKEAQMHFVITYRFTPETRDAAQKRFLSIMSDEEIQEVLGV